MNEFEAKLYNAVIDNNTDLLSELLKEQQVDINFKTENGGTLLHYAKSKEMVEILMSAGIDWTIQDNEGMTAFAKNFERVYIKTYENILRSIHQHRFEHISKFLRFVNHKIHNRIKIMSGQNTL